eukprot:783408_1
MAGQDRDNEWVLQNVLTIILSVLAGIAVCASIVGILYGLGVVMVHLGSECTKDAVVVEPKPDAVAKLTPATVYRRDPADGGAGSEIFVMFAKVKKTDDDYQDYQITIYRGEVAVAPLIKITSASGVAFTSTDDKEAVKACPNGDPKKSNHKPNHHATYVCIVVTKAVVGEKYKFTYQPVESANPVTDKLSEVSGEVVAAATETNPFQQIVAGGKSSFITTIAAAAASGFMTAIILVAVMNFFKKKEPAKERLVAKYDATVV